MTDEAPYMDAGLSVGERVEDLLSRMSIEEKAGQLCQIDAHRGWEEWVGDKLAGSFLNLLGEETQLGTPCYKVGMNIGGRGIYLWIEKAEPHRIVRKDDLTANVVMKLSPNP